MGTVTQHLLNVSNARRDRGVIAGSVSPKSTSLSCQVVSDRLLLTSGASGRRPCRPPRSMVTSFRAAGEFGLSLGPGGPCSLPLFAALPPRSSREQSLARRRSPFPKAPRTARRFFSCPTNGLSMLVLLSPRPATLGGSYVVGLGNFSPMISFHYSRTPAARRKRSRFPYLDASPSSGASLVGASSLRPCPRDLSNCTHESVKPRRCGHGCLNRTSAARQCRASAPPHFVRRPGGIASPLGLGERRGLRLLAPALELLRPRLPSGRAGTRIPARPLFFLGQRNPTGVIPILESPRSVAS